MLKYCSSHTVPHLLHGWPHQGWRKTTLHLLVTFFLMSPIEVPLLSYEDTGLAQGWRLLQQDPQVLLCICAYQLVSLQQALAYAATTTHQRQATAFTLCWISWGFSLQFSIPHRFLWIADGKLCPIVWNFNKDTEQYEPWSRTVTASSNCLCATDDNSDAVCLDIPPFFYITYDSLPYT